jgi:hypothetical protein
MKPASHFEAFWLPAFDSTADPDEVLDVGFDWLRRTERAQGVRGLIAMYSASMRRNRPAIAAAPWEIVSPRSRSGYRIGAPVLAIWPPEEVLELAEQMATRSSLCVIPWEMADIAAWIERTGAKCLVEGFDAPVRATLPADIEEELRHVAAFGGHNGFLGGGEKEVSIRAFHRIARRQGAPTREGIEDYFRSGGEVNADGVRRAGKWYEEVQQGKRHLDYRREVIR